MDPLKPKRKFVGIRLPPGYEKILNEAVEQDARQPEDANMPEVQNQLKRFGTINPAD